MNTAIPNVQLIEEVEAFVRNLLAEHLTEHHQYHNLAHTMDVREAVLKLGAHSGLEEEEMEVLELAALFHDTGFSEVYEGHEAVSRRIAHDFLAKRGYPEDRLQKVLQCIDDTHPELRPGSKLSELLCDADLSHLAKPEYVEISLGLRREWRFFLNRAFNKTAWRKNSFEFLKNHKYYSLAAQELFDPGKNKNLELLSLKVAQDKKKNKKVKKTGIRGSRTAQMMFKAALRNHIDLANLADNKANILLSVNALIITVVVPMSISRVGENFYLIFPLGSLLITSLTSMIFATLATRPIRMTGKTPKDLISSGRANLFFFGNFYRMNFDQFREGMEQVVNDENMMEASVMRDLFFLGKSLGKKYYQLRVCYTVFMVGVIATVLVFVISYLAFAYATPGGWG